MNRLLQKTLLTIDITIQRITRMFNPIYDFSPVVAGFGNISNPVQLEHEIDPKLEGFLFAVPKSRRSLEVRRTRRMTQFHFSYYKPKRDLVTCFECGFWHQRKTICPNCYEKVRDETEKLRQSIGEDGTIPADSELRFLYSGEEDSGLPTAERVVRVDRERPSWFPNSLLSKAPRENNE